MYKILLVFSLIAVGFATKSSTTLDSSGVVLNVKNLKRNKFVLAFTNDIINNFNLTIEVKKRKCIRVSLDACRPLEYLLPDTDINGNWGLKVSSEWLIVSKDGVSVVEYKFEDLCYQKMWRAGYNYQLSTQYVPGKVEVKSIDDKTLPNCSFTYTPNYDDCEMITPLYCRTTYFPQCTCSGIKGVSQYYYCGVQEYLGYQEDHKRVGEVDCLECFSGRCIRKKDEHGELVETVCPRDPFDRCSGDLA